VRVIGEEDVVATSEEADPEAQAADDRFLAALTAGAKDRPESRILDRLVGDWQARTEWEPLVGRGVRITTARAQGRWVFDGRVVDLHTIGDDGGEVSRLTCAFDPTVGDYMALSVHVLSTYFAMERGHYDPVADTLVFDGMEPVRNGRPDVHVRRTFRFETPDHFTVDIGYPDVPIGTYGPMRVIYDRVEG
jgi:hypothetical protein